MARTHTLPCTRIPTPYLARRHKVRCTGLTLCTAATAAMFSFNAVMADTVRARFPREAYSTSNTFLRMFPDLPAFAEQTDTNRDAAAQLGAADGILDAADRLDDPLQSILDPAQFSPNNADNPEMTAGITFIGQFLDHDVTFDRRSALNTNANPNRTLNFRTAAFDLDHVYGRGPQAQPELYESDGTAIRFRIEEIEGSAEVARGDENRTDLPRDNFGEAIMADSRNDENVIVSQFHLAMLRFHNAVTDHLLAQPGNETLTPAQLFEQAQQLVRWHYQWIILNEYLPATIGQERVDALRRDGLQFYDPSEGDDNSSDAVPTSDNHSARNRRSGQGRANRSGQRHAGPRIPIEFSVAAFRFGHSQVRPSYRLNFGADADSQFFAFVLDNREDGNASDPNDLRGGKRAPRRFVDWQTFFDFGDGNVRPNKIIDTRISTVLFHLPGSDVPSPGLPDDGQISLPSRNLIRHVNFGLPSGQAVAARIGVEVLGSDALAELAPFGMTQSTPLWYYILKEAEVLEGGLRLGPVGSAIVGEVFIGLLRADSTAYLNANPSFTPTLPSAAGTGQFEMTDLLRFAGVVIPLE